MKLNNKGFAISSIMYIILIMAVILISVTLAILSSRKLILDKIKKETTDNIYGISYNSVINTLKHEAINYASSNNLNNKSIKIGDLETTVSQELLEHHELLDKYLTLKKVNYNYDVYLGQAKKISDISTSIHNMIDIVDYKIYGNSTQEGENLFNKNDIDKTRYLSITNNDFLSSELYYSTNYIPVMENIQYVKKGVFGASQNIGYFDIDKNIIGKVVKINENVPFTTPSGCAYIICNVGADASPFNDAILMQAPALETPIEVKSVGERTRNLFDVEYFKVLDGWIKHGSYQYKPIALEAGKKYTISFNSVNAIASFGGTLRIGRIKDSTNYTSIFQLAFNQNNTTTGNKSYTFTSQGNEVFYSYVPNYLSEAKLKTLFEKDVIDIQIEEGAQVTDLEPYGYKIPIKVSNDIEDIITDIYLNKPLRKIGDNADYIDYENNRIVRTTKQLMLKGTESWYLGTSGTNVINQRFYVTLSDAVPRSKVMCNSLPEIYSGSTSIFSKDKVGCNISNGNMLQVKIPKETLTNAGYDVTAAGFKSYLADNPLTIFYQLTEENYEYEEIELPNIQTNIGSSTIEINTSVEPSNVEFTVIEMIVKI